MTTLALAALLVVSAVVGVVHSESNVHVVCTGQEDRTNLTINAEGRLLVGGKLMPEHEEIVVNPQTCIDYPDWQMTVAGHLR